MPTANLVGFCDLDLRERLSVAFVGSAIASANKTAGGKVGVAKVGEVA